MNASPTSQPTAFIPLAISLAALATVLDHIAVFGAAPQSDEGAGPYLAVPHGWTSTGGRVHAVKWLPRAPRTAMQVLGVQVGVAFAALAPVCWLGW